MKKPPEEQPKERFFASMKLFYVIVGTLWAVVLLLIIFVAYHWTR